MFQLKYGPPRKVREFALKSWPNPLLPVRVVFVPSAATTPRNPLNPKLG